MDAKIILDTVSTGLLGKVFIELVDTMPAPPANCNYFWRWAYDFAQRLASNSAKVGSTRP